MATEPANGADDPFTAAYRAYLEAVKAAWAQVDVDELVSAQKSVSFENYDCAGSVSTVGTVWCIGSAGGTLGTAGTIGCVAVTKEE